MFYVAIFGESWKGQWRCGAGFRKKGYVQGKNLSPSKERFWAFVLRSVGEMMNEAQRNESWKMWADYDLAQRFQSAMTSSYLTISVRHEILRLGFADDSNLRIHQSMFFHSQIIIKPWCDSLIRRKKNHNEFHQKNVSKEKLTETTTSHQQTTQNSFDLSIFLMTGWKTSLQILGCQRSELKIDELTGDDQTSSIVFCYVYDKSSFKSWWDGTVACFLPVKIYTRQVVRHILLLITCSSKN
jgi:hypothetical protein